MAEVITETILPGTYIEVRAEGLLTVGAIATGNIGVVGTAEMGSARVELLSSYEEARAKFGDAGAWDPSLGNDNLGLVRTLKLLFDNGARTVYARRVFDENSAEHATFNLLDQANASILTLRAKTPGTAGNRLQIRVEEVESREYVESEQVHLSNGTFSLSAEQIFVPPSNGNGQAAEAVLGAVTVRDHGLVNRYQLKQSAASTQVVQLNPGDRSLAFNTQPSPNASVRASYWVPQTSARKVTIRFGNVQEVYIVPSVSYLAQQLQSETSPSKLVDVVQSNGSGLPATNTRFEGFADGKNGAVSRAHFQAALEDLVDRNVQIVAVGGRGFTDVKADILAHVEKTENLGRERIAIVGADTDDVEKILEHANEIADKRVVLVAPGLRQSDPITGKTSTLPASYAAAAIAGKLSSLAPHVSLTNKTLAGIDGLVRDYNYGQLKSLVQSRVLALQRKRGIRVVKGVTTHDEAFKQITLRRIVDYVKEGTRQGANQYIGKLNNKRVRENLRTTLDSFLSDLLIREFLTGYTLIVFADRPMEIRGEVQVTMDLNPTFSIDVIRVVMNLN